MILFPAIDLKEGLAVRLQQGDMARATVFHRDPAAQARAFEQAGFEYLHIVDLDGAFAGKPVNAAAVDRILESVSIPLQLGGGIRNTATVEAWLEKGVTRVIIGTAAVRDPPFVKQAARDYPGKIAVGLDARAGKVAVQGWAETSQLSALEIARRFEDVGVAAIVYTDVARDGMLKGLNLDATVSLAEKVSIPVIASGGFASFEDVEHLVELKSQILEGAIIGRALYDGRIDVKKALALSTLVSVEHVKEILARMGWHEASPPNAKIQQWITSDKSAVMLPANEPLPIEVLVDLFDQLRRYPSWRTATQTRKRGSH